MVACVSARVRGAFGDVGVAVSRCTCGVLVFCFLVLKIIFNSLF